MTHWLAVLRQTLRDPVFQAKGRRALILGDPAHRAADLCDAAGMQVVRVAVAHGVAARLFEDTENDLVVRADVGALPFRDATFDLVIVHATLEFTHDDRQAVGELARVLAVDGRLIVRLPRRGRLAAIDALNLYRYTRELSGRGGIAPESLPIGWRRHYGLDDLDAVFLRPELVVSRIDGGGLGIGEAAYWPALVLTRTILKRPALAQRLRQVYARIGDLDESLSGPATLVVAARRTASVGHGHTEPPHPEIHSGLGDIRTG